MSGRGRKVGSLKAARSKDRQRRRKVTPAEDRTPVEPITVKSPGRRLDRNLKP